MPVTPEQRPKVTSQPVQLSTQYSYPAANNTHDRENYTLAMTSSLVPVLGSNSGQTE